MQVFQTCGVPPSAGRRVLATKGSTRNNRKALQKSAAENTSRKMLELLLERGLAAKVPDTFPFMSLLSSPADSDAYRILRQNVAGGDDSFPHTGPLPLQECHSVQTATRWSRVRTEDSVTATTRHGRSSEYQSLH